MAIDLPFEPPLEPMLAKAIDGPARRRRLAVRAEVGRLPGARLPRRRRGATPSRATSSRSIATSPSWPTRSGRRCPTAACSTARSSSPATAALAVRVAAAAHPPGRVAGQDAGRASRRRRSSPGTCSRSATRTCATCRRASAGPGWRRCSGRRAAAGPPDARDARPGARRRLVRPVRGRRPRRRHRQAPRRAVPARQAGDAQDQAPAHGRLRRGRVPLAQERARARTSARCCSGCSTTRARSTTSASRRRSPGTSAPRSTEELAPLRERRARRPPVAGVGRVGVAGDADASGQRLPGATSRWNRGKDLSWEPLRAGARRRGRLRPPPGRPLPPRHDVPALAPRQAAGRLPLRPARDATPYELAQIFGA